MSHTVIDGIDYGPLAALVGTWKGDKGVDVAPEPDGDERNPFYETIVFEAAGHRYRKGVLLVAVDVVRADHRVRERYGTSSGRCRRVRVSA